MPIEFENVTYVYSPQSPFEKKALESVNVLISEGEFVAVLGKTGSGKSTFVQLMNGLLKPSEGKVIVDGFDTRYKGESAFGVKKKVGIVFQYPEHQFFEENVISELAFGPKNFGFDGEILKEKVAQAIDMVGLDGALLYKSPFSLSGGEKRKVALASILACDPKYLVFDEPTSGLDPLSVKMLSKTLKALKEAGKTVVVVTHSVEFALDNFERILLFSSGKIVADSKKEEVLSKLESEKMLPDVYLLAKEVEKLRFSNARLKEDLRFLKKFVS